MHSFCGKGGRSDERRSSYYAAPAGATPLQGAAVSLSFKHDAIETAACLLRWCPDRAHAFALARHELAAWQYDDSRTEHWRLVLGLLSRNWNIGVSRQVGE